MAWSLHGLRGSGPKLPWEMGATADIPGIPKLGIATLIPAPVAPVVRDAGRDEPSRLSKEQEAARVELLRAAGRVKSGPSPGATDLAEREAALAKWVTIIRAAIAGGAMKGHVADVALMVKETLESKATGTLLARGGSLLLYLGWAKRLGREPFPVEEEVILEYLRYATTQSASRASRFLEALAFWGYLFGAKVDDVFSARARGIALQGLKRKREIVKRDAFTVAFVLWLEDFVVKAAEAKPRGRDLSESIVAGFLLWLVHTRTRCGDSARVVVEPALDLDDTGDGFIETKAQFGMHKTGHQAKKAGLALPMVGCALGVSGKPWARAWLEVRKLAGLEAHCDGCLMPEVLCDGQFGIGRMTTGAVSQWVDFFIVKAGVPAGNYGTHSGKATLLSWAAKAALSRATRRMLGSHADPRDKSMLEYSRDALAGPMAELAKLLLQIRDGRFLPDKTRSGRWAVASASKPVHTKADGQATSPTSVVDSSSSSEDESSSSGEEERARSRELQESAAEQLAASTSAELTARPEFPCEGVLRNADTGTLHRASQSGSPATGCGYVFAMHAAERLEAWPEEAWPVCGRRGCFPKAGQLTARPSSS
jgi:hypothetical protein